MNTPINLQKIVSVKGKPGLYFLKSFNRTGYHLSSFDDRMMFISNEKGKVLALGNVDLKLKDGSINLLEVFKKLSEQTTQLPTADLTRYFQSFIPDLDTSTVAESHLKKVIKWYIMINEKFGLELINEEEDGLQIV